MANINKILVTGNLGYIGSVLTPMLASQGYDVKGLDAGFFKDIEFVPRKKEGLKQVIKDIRDVDESDLKGVDAVIHLAALSNDAQERLGKELMLDINYKASVNLARMAKEVGVERFIFSASCSIYGIAEGDRTEESSINPITTYAISKAKTEEDVSKLADDNFCPVFLRNATCYGTSPRMRFDLVVNNLTAHGYTENEIVILSDGTPWRPLVHIEDVSRAFIAALKAPSDVVRGQVFNVGQNSENYTVKEIGESVLSALPGSKLSIKDETGPDERSYRVNFDKIKVLNDFQPQRKMEEYIRELAGYMKEINFSKSGFEEPKYHTLNFYNSLRERGEINSQLRYEK